MEVVAAIALTISATTVWIAQRKWGHPIANPGLIYLGVVLTGFAIFRWTRVFAECADSCEAQESNHLTLLFITFVQVGIVLVMWAGRQFSTTAEARYIAWAREQHLINNGTE